MKPTQRIDAEALARDLSDAVEGEVRFDAGSRALYATDASNFRQPPIGVVIPRSIEDVIETHRVCREHAAPILPRGCGTSLSGETVNVAVVVDFSKYLDEILDIDPDGRTIRCRPGAINERVNDVAGRHGLMFGPDPATHAYCTIGGNVGNNSCGIHSVHARVSGNGSRTSDNLDALEILTYDGVVMRVGATTEEELERIASGGDRRGEIYRRLRDLRDRYAEIIRDRFVDIPRRVSGFNIDELLPEKGFHVARALAGTEGTCVTILEATIKLVPSPKARSLLVLGYEDIFRVGDHVQQIMAHQPMGCEALDHILFENQQRMHLHPEALSELPDGRAWVLVEFGAGTQDEAEERCHALRAELEKDDDPPIGASLFVDPEQTRRLWEVRESGLAATAFPPGGADAWPGWEDSAVPPERMGDYLRGLKELYDEYGYHGAMYGHLGDGCVHSRISFDLRSAGGIARYRSFLERAADLVVSYGGSLSGEHGDGQQRGELLPRMYGDELMEAFREFKRIWDPAGRMNPGKVIDARPLDADLRLGPDYNPPRPAVRFSYPEDSGDFAHAALRCVGVGKCRKPDAVDVMCPSFMVTREEKHTTRGRARLLYEMLQGDIVRDGWRSHEVKEALDLCLACKGCTNDCPVKVDMPTYKAEFLHRFWKGRLRPRHAYAFGLIDKAARVASWMPGPANFVGRAPGLVHALRLAGGVSQRRRVPSFAPLSLQRWFAVRQPRKEMAPRVILWPDTFTNYLNPSVGVAAVEALEAAGWQVVMPSSHVCCGRPLYDYGMLDQAERYLRRCVDELRDGVRVGTPIVGIEPSCVATFKHELTRILPHDDDARRIERNTYHFAEFVDRFDVRLPRLERDALLWVHCHQKATGGAAPERTVLERMGMRVEEAKGGCCGLAGSWGFEADHHDLSLEIGEQALLPRVREADRRTVIVANGFSCGTQIEEGSTGRRALHVAEVIKMAREFGPPGPSGERPERVRADSPGASLSRKVRRAGGLVATAAALGGVGVALRRPARGRLTPARQVRARRRRAG